MERRNWLVRMIFGLGALLKLGLGIPFVVYLLDPRRRAAAVGDFIPVGKLEDLAPGVPKEMPVTAIRQDAYTYHPNEVVGRVWLIRSDNADAPVTAFTTICPHLGCSINYQPSSERFLCPCHNGTFTKAGERISDQELGRANPVPRGMDRLECKVVDGVVQVKYDNYLQGMHEKVKKA